MMLVYFTENLPSSSYNVVRPMDKERGKFRVSTKLTLATVFAALVFIVTSQIPPIPIPATSGYFNVGETIIYVAALLFGSAVGALSGGIGAMLADIYLGFGVFAPGTLVIKGIEGAIVGFLNLRLRYITNRTLRAVVSVIAGGLEMVTGYFLYEQLVLGSALAFAEVPFNIVQMLVGLAIAMPIMHAVQRVFPQLKN
jgi:uncharacterized membrane protein